MTWFQAFLYALGAGFAISILDYTSLSRIPKIRRPATFTDPPYLLKFFGHPFIGGFLSVALHQSVSNYTPIVAVAVGAAAPSIWRALMRSGAGMLRQFIGELGQSEVPRSHPPGSDERGEHN